MDIRPIRNDQDRQAALAEIEKLWGAPIGTPEGDKLDVLATLVETYEERRWPISGRRRFDPVDVLLYTIEELGPYPVRTGENPRLAFAGVGSPVPPPASYTGDDSEDHRELENPGRPAGAALSDRRGLNPAKAAISLACGAEGPPL
jgi:hypothetical protein